MTDKAAPPDPGKLQIVPSGIGGLDTILRGGFFQGGITIIQGKPGAGKTIFGNQLCFNHVANGQNALFVTLLAETHTRMLLHIGNLEFFDGDVIPDQLAYLSAFPVMEAEGLSGLLKLLRHEIRARRATLLVLDGLVAAEKAADSDMAFKKFIHELQLQATTTNCTMFLLTSSSDGADLTTAEHTMVDCVIEMRSRLYGWRAERDLEILKRRGDGFLRGRHAFRVNDTGITVFPRFEALPTAPPEIERVDASRASTGLGSLDGMFDGGFPQPSNTMLIGAAGSGKTTLGLHFLGQCTRQEQGLFFGFYEAPDRIKAKAVALELPVAQLFDQGHVNLIWQPMTETLLDETCAQLLEEVRRRSVKRLFLDGLGGLATLAEETERVGHILTALVHELRSLGVTSIFTKEGDHLLNSLLEAPASGLSLPSVSAIADNILLFNFFKLRSRLYRTVSVFKVRDSRVDHQTRLFDITNRGLVVDDSGERAEAIFAEAMGQAPISNRQPGNAPRNPRRSGR
jgi:circadian clock protein KaiC